MHQINIPTLMQVVEHNVIGMREVCWFHGEAGCGKTQGIAAAINQIDRRFQEADEDRRAILIDIRLGQHDTVDLKGYPEVEGKMMVWRPAHTLPVIGNPHFRPQDIKVIFYDEADHAKDAVKGVAYQALEQFRIGEFAFMENTYQCAAGNRPQDRGVGGKNPPPLNNRCTHYGVGPDADAWVQWAMEQSHINAELLGFLSFRKDLISTYNPKSVEPAFASPRTWEKVGKYETAPNFPKSIKEASIEGAVGQAASIEYHSFKEMIRDMVSLADIEANPTGVAIPEELGVKWATSTGIGGEMARRPESVTALHKFMKRMPQDFMILSWQIACRKNRKLIETPEFLEIAETKAKVFASAVC